MVSMIKKVVSKRKLTDPDEDLKDLEYWLSRPPEERIEAVELLRRQFHGSAIRFQRIDRVIQRKKR